MIASGLGTHTSCISTDAKKYVLELGAIGEGFSIIGIGVTKISMCLTLLRIVELARRRTAQFLWCLLIFIVITHFGLGMMYFLNCRPLTAVWNRSGASRLPTHAINLASYVIFAMDAVTDLICAMIPILLVQRLQMDMRTKLALSGLMSLGVLTAGCAVAKLLALRRVTDDDFTWGLNTVAIWGAVERFLGIIIISVPMLRPLFSRSHHSFHKWFRSRFNALIYSSKGKNHSGSSSVELTQSKQQIARSGLNLRDIEESPVPPVPCHAHIQEGRNHHANSIHLTLTDGEYAKENMRDDSEKK